MSHISFLLRCTLGIFIFWFLWFLFEHKLPAKVSGYGILIHALIVFSFSIKLINDKIINTRSKIFISTGYFFLALSDFLWGINYFINFNSTRSWLGISVSILISFSFLSYFLGILYAIKKPSRFFELKITLTSLIMSFSLIGTIILYPCLVSGQNLTTGFFGIVEISSILASFSLLFLSIMVLLGSGSLKWSIFSAGIMCLVLADLSIRVEKILTDSIHFDMYSVLFSFGLYSSMIPFFIRKKMKFISRVNYQSLFISYKLGSIFILFVTLISFLYSQLNNLNALRMVVLCISCASFAIIFLSFFLVEKIKRLSIVLSNILQGDIYGSKIQSFKKDKLPRELQDHYKYVLASAMKEYKNKILKEKLKSKNIALRQVAHNIISPISTLDFQISDLKFESEKSYILMKKSIQNIRDIANSLLKNKNSISEFSEFQESHLLVNLLDIIISQKRIEYKSFPNIKIKQKYDKNCFFIFSNVNESEFSSVISNLINNSVQSLNGKGEIYINFSEDSGVITLSIIDNGCGISAEIIKEIGKLGKSFNKEGSGIGLYHSKKYLNTLGGDLQIESDGTSGTKVDLIFSSCTPPKWFTPYIEIDALTTIVVLDDNELIHEYWQKRFSKYSQIYTLHFYNFNDFIKWFLDNNKKSILYFIDYELKDKKNNGLDIIKELKIKDSSFLITSYIHERKIRTQCLNENIKLIPKNYLNLFPIIFHENKLNNNNIYYDAVLIDDNILIRDYWEQKANEKGKHFLAFDSLKDFYTNIHSICRNTPIYIDSELENGIKGEIAAKKINIYYGFKYIFLCTAHTSFDKKKYPWINDIIGKDPLW